MGAVDAHVISRLQMLAGMSFMDQVLRWASECGHVEVVRLLLDRGADVNAVASTHGHVKVVLARDSWCVLISHDFRDHIMETSYRHRPCCTDIRNGHPWVRLSLVRSSRCL